MRVFRPRAGVGLRRSFSTFKICTDLGLTQAYLVHPDTGAEPYSLGEGLTAIGLLRFVAALRSGELPV